MRVRKTAFKFKPNTSTTGRYIQNTQLRAAVNWLAKYGNKSSVDLSTFWAKIEFPMILMLEIVTLAWSINSRSVSRACMQDHMQSSQLNPSRTGSRGIRLLVCLLLMLEPTTCCTIKEYFVQNIVQQMVGSNISNKQTSRRIPRDPVLEGLKTV